MHEAIEILGPVCNKDAPPLDAILLQCEFLEADNKAAEAFKLLDAIAADYWDEPRFLVGYVHYGHAAGQDELAGKAFARLLELRQEGKVPPEMLQPGTLEQIIEIGKDYRNRGETLRQMMVAGRMPWLFAEHALGNPPVWAWTLHTQRLPWVSEEPQTRAAFSVYASNGFTPSTTTGTARSLSNLLLCRLREHTSLRTCQRF